MRKYICVFLLCLGFLSISHNAYSQVSTVWKIVKRAKDVYELCNFLNDKFHFIDKKEHGTTVLQTSYGECDWSKIQLSHMNQPKVKYSSSIYSKYYTTNYTTNYSRIVNYNEVSRILKQSSYSYSPVPMPTYVPKNSSPNFAFYRHDNLFIKKQPNRGIEYMPIVEFSTPLPRHVVSQYEIRELLIP